MKYISKAARQLEGELVLQSDAQALLYRAVADVTNLLKAQRDGRSSDATDCLRALNALSNVLGEYPGLLPSLKDLLGDPQRELLARNLLKG